MSVIFVSNDLMSSSQVSGAAQSIGATFSCVSSEASLLKAFETDDVKLVVIDLNARGLDLSALVPEIRQRSSDVAVVAFGPHVHTQRLEAAATAGCDEVLTRGAFFRDTAALMQRYLKVVE